MVAAGRHVALLRGINVGRSQRVAMADLRKIMEELGYNDVQTLLNSGNVVFGGVVETSSAAAARIEAAVADRLGVSARVFVLSAAQLATAVAQNPFADVAHDPARMLVTFFNDPADHSRLAPLLEQDWAPEALVVHSSAAYLWCPLGILAGRLFAAVDRLLGNAVTARNWGTVMKLHVLVAAPERQPRRKP